MKNWNTIGRRTLADGRYVPPFREAQRGTLDFNVVEYLLNGSRSVSEASPLFHNPHQVLSRSPPSLRI